MKISDTPFFETTPCFTNPSLFMEKFWMPWLIVKQFLVIEIGHTWPKKNVQPFWHHIWQRVPKPLFYEDPLCYPTPHFQILFTPNPHLLLTLPLTVSFMHQGVKYWSLVDMTWLFANTLIRYHTQTHEPHSKLSVDWLTQVVSRLTYPYKYILTPPAMYSQHLSVLHWMNNFLMSKLHFTEFYNVFAFQKLITCRCCISLNYIQ